MFSLLFVFVLDFSHLLFYHQLPLDVVTPTNVKHCHPLKHRCSFKLCCPPPLGITATQCHPPLELCCHSTAQMFSPLELCCCSNVTQASHSPSNVTPTQMPPPQTLLPCKCHPPWTLLLGKRCSGLALPPPPWTSPPLKHPPLKLHHHTNIIPLDLCSWSNVTQASPPFKYCLKCCPLKLCRWANIIQASTSLSPQMLLPLKHCPFCVFLVSYM